MQNQLFDHKVFEHTVQQGEVEKIWKLVKLKQTLNTQLLANRQHVVFQNIRDCRAISEDLFEFLQARELAHFSNKAFSPQPNGAEEAQPARDETGVIEHQLSRIKQEIKSINANVIGIEKEVTKLSALLD